ncbi:MAG TPA: bifunctional oligoribonuclease/PAP phosphatase NrnA [Firmicutes bacterium]|nr:bifunctional oligoribonuclease/PAP phosphatase NrnA [Bacillota bacterium]
MSENPAPSYKEALAAVSDVLHRYDRFILAGHVDPDPDSICSLLALEWALTEMGKVAVAVSPDQPPPTLKFLPRQERIRRPHEVDPRDWQVLIVIDCDLPRSGAAAAWADQVELVVNIDHHVTNSATAPVLLLNTEAAAAGEIIYHLIQELGLSLPEETAILLYTAILTDTGSFRFSNTNARVLRIAADLVDKGADPAVIASEMYDTRPWSYMQMLRRVLATLDCSADGRIAWIILGEADLLEAGMRQEESEGLIQFPRMIQGVEVAILFREVGPREVRVSFRSRNKVDVSRLAQSFGGGGHARAAGCTIKLPLAAACREVLTKTEAFLAEAAAGR